MTIRTWSLALAGAALISGCASPLADKSADVAVRQVVVQSWNQLSYNFEGDVGFDEFRMTLPAKPGEASSPLSPQLAAGMSEVARSFSGRFTGAIDKASGRMEVIPEMRLERRNLLFSIKLPLLVDFNDLSLLIDPSAADLFVPELRQHEGKYLRLKMPTEAAKGFPLKALDQAMPKLLNDSYAQLDKSVFSIQPQDDYAREVGASYRLRTSLSRPQEQKLTQALLAGMLKVAQQHKPRQPGQSALDAEAMLQIVQALTQKDAKLMEQSQTISDYYTDRGGRILAVRQQLSLDMQGMHLRGHTRFRYSRFDRPQFTIQPAESDIIDASALKSLNFLKQAAHGATASAAQ